MTSDRDDQITPHHDLSPEDISGVKMGVVLLAIMSICIIFGLALSAFCPHMYERLKTIGYVIIAGPDNASDDD